MKKVDALTVLRYWDKKGRYVFTKRDLSKLFFNNSSTTLTGSLNRLVHDGILVRACYGIYVNSHTYSFDSYVI